MAETVHPRLNKASASTSSPTENIAGGSSCWSAWTPSASGSPPREWRTLLRANHAGSGVGSFSDRDWGEIRDRYQVRTGALLGKGCPEDLPGNRPRPNAVGTLTDTTFTPLLNGDEHDR